MRQGRQSLVAALRRLLARSPLAPGTRPAGEGAALLDPAHFDATLTGFSAQIEAAQRRAGQLLAEYRERTDESVRLAGLPRAQLLTDSVLLEGRPSLRLRVSRLSVGDRVEQPFSEWMGVTRSGTDAPDVQMLWEGLLAIEQATGDATLRGGPSTLLDVGAAVVSKDDDTIRIALREEDAEPRPEIPIVAVPRFTGDLPKQKLRNVGHWLLDCVPQVVTLAAAAPGARFLLPESIGGVHRRTLSLAGVAEDRLVAWNGSPTTCGRLVVFESTGQPGGGRPLSALMEMRRLLSPAEWPEPRGRRIYVSRRDAKDTRRWIDNEHDVEALFAARGFEIVVMGDCPLEEQVRIFRGARVVAGVSGAGLADIVFAPPGIDVMVLVPDGLIRWYAKEAGARSGWASGARAAGNTDLAALGDSPRFYAHLAAAFSQRCHSFVCSDRMPIDRLTGFVDDVLAQVDLP